MISNDEIKHLLAEYADAEKAAFLPRFFQSFAGGYGEGDHFIGVTVPNLRKVAKKVYKDIYIDSIIKLLQEPVHEYRLLALFILVYLFEKAAGEQEREDIVKIYLDNIPYINNWDLVDSSADKILGPYLFTKDKALLFELAGTEHLWKQRIAVMTTFYFIKQGRFEETLELARILLKHKHDLIHKAVGWMLREIGKRNIDVELEFLKEHYRQMPRTMLRYAIEKFEPELREQFMK